MFYLVQTLSTKIHTFYSLRLILQIYKRRIIESFKDLGFLALQKTSSLLSDYWTWPILKHFLLHFWGMQKNLLLFAKFGEFNALNDSVLKFKIPKVSGKMFMQLRTIPWCWSKLHFNHKTMRNPLQTVLQIISYGYPVTYIDRCQGVDS